MRILFGFLFDMQILNLSEGICIPQSLIPTHLLKPFADVLY